MTAGKYVDLDAAFEEQDQADEPLIVKLMGEEWELPGSPPATVTLRMLTWVENGWVDDDDNFSDDVDNAQLIALFRDLVPRDVMQAWLDKGLDTNRLVALTGVLLEQYKEQFEEAHAQGEARARGNRAARRSSKPSPSGGRSSKRTSTGSTKSKASSKS